MPSAIAKVAPSALALTGALVLPKIVKGTGKFVMTGISAAEITGVEPCKVTYGTKTYDGAKVYTVHGSYFKALVNPTALLLGWTQAKSSPTALVTMDSVTGTLPGYTEEVKKMKQLKENF